MSWSGLARWSGYLAFSPEFTLSKAEWGRAVRCLLFPPPFRLRRKGGGKRVPFILLKAKQLVLSVVEGTLGSRDCVSPVL